MSEHTFVPHVLSLCGFPVILIDQMYTDYSCDINDAVLTQGHAEVAE